MDEKILKEIESLAAELSKEDLDDVLMFIKIRGYALKGKCKHLSSIEWMIFKPSQKNWHYIRVRFWAGIASLKGKCIQWERKTT